MPNLVQRAKNFLKSVVIFILKLIFAYVGWVIRGFNFNPMLADFRANWHKIWGNSGWFGYREALQTNYNSYIHTFALLLYLPLLWDVICLVKPLFQNHQHKSAPTEKKRSKWAKPVKVPMASSAGEAQSAPGSEIEAKRELGEGVGNADLLATPQGEGSSNPHTPQLKRFILKRRGDGAVVLQHASSEVKAIIKP